MHGRTMGWVVACCGGLLLAIACGGVTTSDGSGSGSGGNGGSGAKGAASGDCDDLRRQVDDALELAKVCDPALDEPSCGLIVEGACCRRAVSPESQAVEAYKEALARAKAAGCYTEMCMSIDCADPIDGDCRALPVGTSGACVEQY